jgi:hypothetical protein
MIDYEEFKEKNKELIKETAREFNNHLNAEFYITTTLEEDEKHKRYKHLFN